jgi:hypothetical protein
MTKKTLQYYLGILGEALIFLILYLIPVSILFLSVYGLYNILIKFGVI